MIIGNNSNFNDKIFENKFKKYKEDNEFISSNKKKNIFTKDIKETQYQDVTNKDDMYDKSLAMLHERLNNGLISLDEFNKKCNELAKKRNK